MVPYAEWLFYAGLATALHCIIWWQLFPSGDYQPLLMPVNERTWRELVH